VVQFSNEIWLSFRLTQAAVKFVKEKSKISNLEFRSLNQVSKPTATRDLEDLAAKNIFERVGITGKGTYYKLKKC